MRASSDEVAALKARLRERQAQRQFDADADEAIRLVQHRGPGGAGGAGVRGTGDPGGAGVQRGGGGRDIGPVGDRQLAFPAGAGLRGVWGRGGDLRIYHSTDDTPFPLRGLPPEGAARGRYGTAPWWGRRGG